MCRVTASTAGFLLWASSLAPALIVGPVWAQDQPEYMFAEGEHTQALLWFYSERTHATLPEFLVTCADSLVARAREFYQPGAARADAEAAQPLILNVYNTRKGPLGFTAAVEGISPGSSAGTVQYVHAPSRSVFVRMRPSPADRHLVELRIPVDALRRTLASAAQIIQLDCGPDAGRSPLWFRQGAALVLAQDCLSQQGVDRSGEMSVYLGTQILAVQRLILAGQLPSLEELLMDTLPPVEEHQAPSEGVDWGPDQVQGLRAVIVQFLREECGQRGGWAALCAELARGLRGKEAVDRLGSVFGPGGMAAVEAAFLRWVESRRPLWDDAQPALQLHGQGWAQSPIMGNAIAWNQTPVPEPPYVISGELRTFADAKTSSAQANLLFGRLGQDHLQVSIHSQGGLSVWDYKGAQGEYNNLMTKRWDGAYSVQEFCPFQILVTPEDAFVTVRGIELSPFSVLGRDMGGAFGLGTFKGSTTVWRNLTIEAVRSPEDG